MENIVENLSHLIHWPMGREHILNIYDFTIAKMQKLPPHDKTTHTQTQTHHLDFIKRTTYRKPNRINFAV